MITSLHIKNFKSLRDVPLALGALNFFIGTNASGKSNVFDALRVLQGVGYGFAIGEVLDGKPKSATSEVWEAIRGGSAKATFAGASTEPITFEIQLGGPSGTASYGLSFDAINQRLVNEWLTVGEKNIFDSRSLSQDGADPVFYVRYCTGKKAPRSKLSFAANRPVLSQIAFGNGGKCASKHVELANGVCVALANMQRIDPSPSVLRSYSQAQQISRMGDRGENFAALVRTICKDPKLKDAYLSWLRHLRPDEIQDVGVMTGAVGEPLFSLTETNGTVFPAPVLSDGTLRFAAIVAAFLQPDMPALLKIEEIENGIHANRMRLLVELLRTRAQAGKTQVIATTHSPIVLAWLKESEYAYTFFCKRDEETGESKILPLTQVPNFTEIVRKQPIGELFSEGWMEAAL
jgi:energy-coupling factor transporter ATP-binding protein EcfA2